MDMLRVAKNKIQKHNLNPSFNPSINPTLNDISTSNKIPIHPDYNNCVSTWSVDLDEIAPEERDTPEPCSFTEPLELLSNPRDVVYYPLTMTY